MTTRKKFSPLILILYSVCVICPVSPLICHGKQIRLAYLQNDIHQLACWVALEKGYFQEEGASVRIAGMFKAGPELMSAFAAGALDVGYVGESPATTAVANGVAQVSILAQVNTEGSAIVIRQDSKIKALQELKGRRVAIPGYSTVQDFLLRKALKTQNIPSNQVNIIVLKPPDMIGALQTKQIDAFIAWEPYPAKAQTMSVGKVLLSSGDIWADHPCCVLAVDNRFLKTSSSAVKGILRAHLKATDFINHYSDKALKIGSKYTGLEVETVKLAISNVNYTYHISTEGEKEYVEFLSKLRYIKTKDPQLFLKSFINFQLLQGELSRK